MSPHIAPVPPAEPDRLMTTREVADLLRVSPSMIRALVRRGELSAIYVGRLPRYGAADVRAYLTRARARGGTR
jgi:excisionase family DNA binding protein